MRTLIARSLKCLAGVLESCERAHPVSLWDGRRV